MDTSDTSHVRLGEVRRRRGCGRAQVYRDVEAGVFPPGIRKGTRWTFWPSYEVELVNRAEIAGASVAERKRLVKALIKQRAQLMPRIPAATERGEGAAA